MRRTIAIELISVGIILTLGLTNCERSNHTGHQDQTNEMKVVTPDGATLDMIVRVKKSESKIDVASVPYILNNKKVEMLKQRIKTASGFQKTTYSFSYGLELMKSGQTNEAIKVLIEVLDLVHKLEAEDPNRQRKKQELIFAVKKQLALAYMRKAEQDNCLANHNNESCIIPISTKAQHTQRSGAENSIKVLNELLLVKPDDYDCQYLLNIAHMTLGQYPLGIAENFRIPESYFGLSVDFPKFSDVAMDLGVAVNDMAGGTCMDDFNNDGYLDIIASSWGFEDQIKYYENDQEGGFTDKTNSTGLVGVTGGLNLRHADYNNDGYLDFVILRGAWLGKMGGVPNSLIKNNGNGTFTDVTIESGFFSLHPTQTAVWDDFNLDGWLDLLIANESSSEIKNHCELFLNNADGTFTDVSMEAGLTELGFFKGVATGDLNNDRYPDIFLSNYNGNNILYLNEGGERDGVTFRNVSSTAGIANPTRSFPTWIFDYNNDGYDDIFVSGYSTDSKTAADLFMENLRNGANTNRPYLYKNNGDGTFKEVGLELGLNEPIATMGCNFGDLDNDGFLDFYLATGDPELFSIVPNRMYRNNNGNNFEDVTYSAGFGHIQKGHGIGFGDLDMDGDQDIYAVMGGAFEGDVYQNLLFENPIGNKNNWIHILLEGTTSNRSAIGAKLILTIEENGQQRKIYHTIGTGASFGGNSLLAEIGLGSAIKIKTLEIFWPSKKKDTSSFKSIIANQYIKIKEGNNSFETIKINAASFKKGRHSH